VIRRITFRPSAQADLSGLYDYIAERAGLSVAEGYLDRIEEACLHLRDFPERGARRDDLAPGLRTIGFERRVLIAFRVLPDEVEIVAIAYGGWQLTEGLAER
jgi:toxin ParE1/3/4